MTKKKILKFVNNKQGKINMLSQVMNVTTDKKENYIAADIDLEQLY